MSICGAKNDPLFLQFVLANRAFALFAGLFHQNGPARRLSGKVRATPGNLRSRRAHRPVEKKIDMVARSQCGGSKYCVEASQRIARARGGFALRLDDDHHDRIRPRDPKRSGLDRNHVHTAGLLANHATCVLCDSSSANRSG